jgi:hypothetical protein
MDEGILQVAAKGMDEGILQVAASGDGWRNTSGSC